MAREPHAHDARDVTEDARRLLAQSSIERPRPRRLPPVAERDGCRAFSATLRDERNLLGEHVTLFLKRLRAAGGYVTQYNVLQSSDDAYHCLSIVLFYTVPKGDHTL
jgi:hypothetical protein